MNSINNIDINQFSGLSTMLQVLYRLTEQMMTGFNTISTETMESSDPMPQVNVDRDVRDEIQCPFMEVFSLTKSDYNT